MYRKHAPNANKSNILYDEGYEKQSHYASNIQKSTVPGQTRGTSSRTCLYRKNRGGGGRNIEEREEKASACHPGGGISSEGTLSDFMDVRFPFENAGNNFFGRIFRPVAKVSFHSATRDLWTDAWMVVDTGADFTILPRYLSEDLGISLEIDCIKDTTVGVGGVQTIYLLKSKIKVKLGHIERTIPLAFFDTNEVPALLGRLGFMETFDIVFLKTHKVLFKG